MVCLAIFCTNIHILSPGRHVGQFKVKRTSFSKLKDTVHDLSHKKDFSEVKLLQKQAEIVRVCIRVRVRVNIILGLIT